MPFSVASNTEVGREYSISFTTSAAAPVSPFNPSGGAGTFVHTVRVDINRNRWVVYNLEGTSEIASGRWRLDDLRSPELQEMLARVLRAEYSDVAGIIAASSSTVFARLYEVRFNGRRGFVRIDIVEHRWRIQDEHERDTGWNASYRWSGFDQADPLLFERVFQTAFGEPTR